jgi:para-aminobenzoate synthetase/4-amino-4-deoxychorismate lyase
MLKMKNSLIGCIIREEPGRECHDRRYGGMTLAIARIGSVQVPELFSIEKYPTVLQMVSTVIGRTSAPMSDLFQALFPPASITGAPKPRTMEIIRELETTSRRIYTGCIGFMSPERKAQFNVAIRTVLVDRKEQRAEYGVGGGITWDSVDSAEYDECLAKAKILTFRLPQFSLLESLLWSPGEGYFLLERHLDRLGKSAAYFNYQVDHEQVKRCLEEASRSFGMEAKKVRVFVGERGEPVIQAESLPEDQKLGPLQVCLAPAPVDSSDPFLYHKTTHRQVYEQAQAACREAYGENWEDVLLWNEKRELTEATVANLLVELDRRLYTPPVRCGLLAGTYRGWLLEQGLVEERVLPLAILLDHPPVYLVNSVRKVRAATITLHSFR